MIRSFRGSGTEDIFNGRVTRAARQTLAQTLWRVAMRKLEALDSAEAIRDRDLRVPPGNRLEQLKAARAGQDSIRINDQFRICFRWTEAGPEDVEIVDYH
jgi:proteic killer suppression protein